MVIRQKTSRDDRRRRVLVDERLNTASRNTSLPLNGDRRKKGRTPRYAEAALAKHQPRICSFLPIRPWSVTLWFLIGLAFVTAHATVFALQLKFTPRDLGVDLAALQIDGPRALSNWSSSLLLLVAAILSAVILQFRRHRIDDYRGDYRVWYYFVAALVLASVNATTGVHSEVRQAAEQTAAAYSVQHATVWINGLVSIIATGVIVRVLVEVRQSRGTVVTVLTAALAYLSHGLLSVAWVVLPSRDFTELASGMSRLIGHYLLLMSLVVYSRHVFLDAQGLLSTRSRKKKRREKKDVAGPQAPTKSKKSESKTETAQAKKTATPVAHDEAIRPPSKKSAGGESGTHSAPASAGAESEEPDTLKMSKSERRRQRKLKRRERRAA